MSFKLPAVLSVILALSQCQEQIIFENEVTITIGEGPEGINVTITDNNSPGENPSGQNAGENIPATSKPPDEEVCQRPVDIVFVLDTARRYMRHRRMELRFIERVAKTFKISPNHTRVGLVLYSNHSTELFGLHAYTTYDTLTSAIEMMHHTFGGRNTPEALYCAYTMLTSCYFGGRPNTGVEQIVVFMTDGVPDTADLLGRVNLLREAGVNIYSMTIGRLAGVQHAEMIASYPRSRYLITVDRYFRLTRIWEDFGKMLCSNIFVPDDIKMEDCPKEQVEAQNLLSKDNTGDTNPALNDEKELL